ncbi:MAG: hypothetical protein K2G04_02175 [Oscillospiraceae bacterium]|nr:hypothetical protein [Oscillospiraceae bacterium]
MKKMLINILMAVIISLSLMTFSACTPKAFEVDIGQEAAGAALAEYLSLTKGFGEGDFLAEPMVMVIEGKSVYAFSWRVKDGENADRLFGTYAVSCDGESFYEYQSERDIWIEDISAGE